MPIILHLSHPVESCIVHLVYNVLFLFGESAQLQGCKISMNPKMLIPCAEAVDAGEKIVYTNAKFIIDESIKFGQEGYWRF